MEQLLVQLLAPELPKIMINMSFSDLKIKEGKSITTQISEFVKISSSEDQYWNSWEKSFGK